MHPIRQFMRTMMCCFLFVFAAMTSSITLLGCVAFDDTPQAVVMKVEGKTKAEDGTLYVQTVQQAAGARGMEAFFEVVKVNDESIYNAIEVGKYYNANLKGNYGQPLKQTEDQEDYRYLDEAPSETPAP